jgi:protein O-GlcNAc transferase
MPDPLEYLLQQAFTFFNAHQLVQAERAYRKVLDRQPYNHEAVHMLGVIAHRQGRAPEALQLLTRAVQMSPDSAPYRCNLGKFFTEQGRHPDAIPHFQRALQLNPADATYYANLGESLRRVGQLDAAEATLREALKVHPDHAPTLGNLGNLLRDQGRVREAIDTLRRSIEIRPAPGVHQSLAFTCFFDSDMLPEQVYDAHLEFWRAYPAAVPAAGWSNDRNPDRVLRLGYVSPDFYHHPVANFIEGALRCHDRAQFQVFCYSSTPREDAVTQRLKSYPLTWRDLRQVPLEELVGQVRADAIDILVDLAGHTANNRAGLFALKPAPVQAAYLGYPGTAGLVTIDHRLTDPVADPPDDVESQHLHVETLAYLPRGLSCYTPLQDAPPISPSPAARNGHITFGSLHTLAKINDRVIALWSRVLDAIPTARLILFRHTLHGPTADRYRQLFAAAGADPARVELRHRPRSKNHLDEYQDIDVQLDTFPFSGHTTACEGLHQGVPILTLPGRSHASRLVASVLTHAGLPDFIAISEDDYVRRAQSLASDLPALATLRSTLRDRLQQSPLYDAPTFTRHLESAYRQMWRTYCAD